MKRLSTLLTLSAVSLAPVAHAAVDADAAQTLMTRSGCFKCHSIDKKKDGPPYRDVARKYKGKADAEATLGEHITTSPTMEVDGVKAQHKAIASRDPAAIHNVVRWIISQ